MTAAGVDALSGGRCVLGLGASGPQVIEGFHGVPYDKPLTRTREIIEICRQVWKRERVEYSGKAYNIPLPEGEGTGLAYGYQRRSRAQGRTRRPAAIRRMYSGTGVCAGQAHWQSTTLWK